MLSMRWNALIASVATFFVAAQAQAQDQVPIDSYNWQSHTNDWMSTGLMPLVALVGLGLLFMIVAALVASVVMNAPWKHRDMV